MKKLINVLTAPISLLLCSAADNALDVNLRALTLTTANKQITFNYNVRLSEQARNVSLVFGTEPEGGKLKEESVQMGTIESGTLINSYTLKDVSNINYKGNNKLTFSFKVGTSVKASGYVIYHPPIENEKIVISSANNGTGVISSYYLENYDKPDRVPHYDKIIFNNFDDLVVNDFYYNLDISFLRFQYEKIGGDSNLNAKCYLGIEDPYGLFPYLPLETGTLNRRVDLKLNKIEDYYSFSFTNLYYETKQHLISTTPREGYYLTDKLMLPKGEENRLDHLRCFISMDINGYAPFNVTGYFYLTYIQKYMGDCSDSKYCTGMNEESQINVREKVIEVNI